MYCNFSTFVPYELFRASSALWDFALSPNPMKRHTTAHRAGSRSGEAPKTSNNVTIDDRSVPIHVC